MTSLTSGSEEPSPPDTAQLSNVADSPKAGSALAWTAVAKAVSQVVTLMTTIVLARLLDKSDFGLMAMALVYMSFIDTFIDFGFGSALIQAPRLVPRQLSSCYWLLTAGCLTVATLTYAYRSGIAEFMGDARIDPMLVLMALSMLSLPTTIVFKAVLSRELQFKAIAVLELLAALLRSVIGVLLALAGCGAMSLAWGFVAEKLLLAGSWFYFNKWRPQVWFSLPDLRQLTAFGLQMSLGNLLWFAYFRADSIIIGRFLGAEILGVYAVATQLGSAGFQFIASSWHRFLFALYSREQASSALPRVFLASSGALAAFALPVFVAISVLAGDIVGLLYGQRWQAAVVPLQVMTLVAAMQSTATLLSHLLNAKGLVGLNVRINFVSILAFVIAFVITTWIWGLYGVLGTWLILYPLRYFAYLRAVVSAVDFSLWDYGAYHFGTVCSSALLFVALISFRSMVDIADIPLRLTASVVVGAIAYIAAQLTLNRPRLREFARFLQP